MFPFLGFLYFRVVEFWLKVDFFFGISIIINKPCSCDWQSVTEACLLHHMIESLETFKIEIMTEETHPC